MTWQKFNKYILISLVILFATIVLFILWANPYRNIPFVNYENELLFDLNQRYQYPSVARDKRFDSAVFGTSSARLLNPDELNKDVGGSFAELALNSATGYEQSEMVKLFINERQDKEPKSIIWGIDNIWCQQEKEYPKYTFRPFPPWMFDDNRWNDLLYLFNGKSLEISGRIALYKIGIRNSYKYEVNGYANFLPDNAEYDLKKVQKNLYAGGKPQLREPIQPAIKPSPAEIEKWIFATHQLLNDTLEIIPAGTMKIFFFVPYHHYFQPASGSLDEAVQKECKQRITNIIKNSENSVVLDFTIPSSITLEDENYWDSLHYRVEIAKELSHQIGNYIHKRAPDKVDYKVLFDYRN